MNTLPIDNINTSIQNLTKDKIVSEVGGNTILPPPPEEKDKKRYRCWMITHHDIAFDMSKIEKIKYLTWQIEKCPKTEKLHIQGYINFEREVSFATVKKRIPGAHIERRMGTEEQAISYCQKEETRIEGPWEIGTIPTPGTRTDLIELRESIKKGASMKEIFENHTSAAFKYPKAIALCSLLYQTKRNWKMNIIVIWGPSGTGKTTKAWQIIGEKPCYVKNPSKWWDGYEGEEFVLLDDFRGSWFTASEMLLLLDNKPHKIEMKGSMTEFRSKTIIITSNHNPKDWYDNIHIKEGIARRINEIHDMTKNIQYHKQEEYANKEVYEHIMNGQKIVEQKYEITPEQLELLKQLII